MKYIEADRLKAEIRRQKHELELSIQSQGDYGQSCHIVAYENIISLIDSLQQEQDILVINKKDWEAQEQFRKNKDFGKPLQQEQQEVDLEKAIDNYLDTIQAWQIQEAPFTSMEKCARYFYELGLKAK